MKRAAGPTLRAPWAWLSGTALTGLLAYVALAVWSGLDGLNAALAGLGPLRIVILLGLSLSGYALRTLRWRRYLAALGHTLPASLNARIYLAGFALTATPGKLGEALRCRLLKPLGVPYTDSLAALLCERMTDVAVIALFALIGLASFSSLHGVVLPACGLVLVAYLACLSETLPAWLESAGRQDGRLRRAASQVARLLRTARRCTRAGTLWPTLGLGTLAWLCEVLAFALLLHWLNTGAGITVALLGYATATLAGALSFLPGGLGGTEAAMIALLSAAGIELGLAVAATLVIRLTTLWFAVALGLAAWVIHAGRTAPDRPE